MQLLPSIDINRLDKMKPLLTQETIVLIGNFDGVHLGHQSLFRYCLELKKQSGLAILVLTFDPNPRQFFAKEESCANLFTPWQKEQAFLELGADFYLCQKFDKELASLAHEVFYEVLLRKLLLAKKIVVGGDFHFGYRRLGSVAWLRAQEERTGILVDVAPFFVHLSETTSSTRVRAALKSADTFSLALAMLGRPYLFCGHLGQSENHADFVSFDFLPEDQLYPALGVYAVKVSIKASQNKNAKILTVASASASGLLCLGSNASSSRAQARLFLPKEQAKIIGAKANFAFVYVEAFVSLEPKVHDLSAFARIWKDKIENERPRS